MNLLALLCALQVSTPPYLAFPQPGLDDSAAYAGYSTRLYRDSRGNTVQIYIDSKVGRVVNLWADALDESIGFTVRDSGGGGPAPVRFGAANATVGATGGRRSLRYTLTLPGDRPIRLGQWLLGSMRIERDFGYAGRVQDSLNAPPFV